MKLKPDQRLVQKDFDCIKPGEVYGGLTVRETYVIEGTYNYIARCDCKCGVTGFITRVNQLRTKNRPAISCGCSRKKHGRWGEPLFIVWRNMMNRCYDPTNKRYTRYGGRGISVCPDWHDMDKFLEDMHYGHAVGLQIDRIDNDGDYGPFNCRWVTHSENSRNKSTNTLLTYNGETKCLTEWAEIVGLTVGTLWDRIKVRKWDVTKSLTTPPMTNAETMKLACAARRKPK